MHQKYKPWASHTRQIILRRQRHDFCVKSTHPSSKPLLFAGMFMTTRIDNPSQAKSLGLWAGSLNPWRGNPEISNFDTQALGLW